MLLQNGEDGENGTIVLLPAWPCSVDVSFKLFAALNTTVELVWVNGAQAALSVEPPERAAAVVFANCSTPESGVRLPILEGMTARKRGGGARRPPPGGPAA